MLKKIFSLLVVFSLCLLAGCGNRSQTSADADGSLAADADETVDSTGANTSMAENSSVSSNPESQNVLIVYFSRPGNTDSPEDIDATTSASLVVKDGTAYGNTEYIATLIQQATGGQLSQIVVQEKYPADYDDTVDRAEQEERDNARPELASEVENMDDYEIVFLGFPNWWYDMPMAVYTFLDEYDLSGKTIIPFVTSGGGGFSNTISAIQELEPGATVLADGFKTTHSRVDGVTFEDVEEWVKGLEIFAAE